MKDQQILKTLEIAKELWEEQKEAQGFAEDKRIAFIIGAYSGLERMHGLCHPFVVGDEA